MEKGLKAHEELQKVNEELQQALWNQTTHSRASVHQPSRTHVDIQPFLHVIMEEQVPPYYMVQKMMSFLGSGDPECDQKAFKAQLLIWGNFNDVWCKIFVGAFIRTTLQCSVGSLIGPLILSRLFFQMFVKQFATNKVKSPRTVNLYDIWQREGELLKDYLNRFCDVSVRIHSPMRKCSLMSL